jgi:hypothetical protein
MTRTLRALFLTGLLGALVLPVSAPPLAGQPPASTPASTIPVADTLPPGDTITPVRVEGVVVTILRSPMQVNRAPFAVSVIQEELGERGRSASSIEEALQGLPGVQVQNRYNAALGEQISIRGFGARSQFGVRGIRILVDGIPATLPDGQASLDHLDLGSLGRVEALRGPGAALYGNAAGGVLHFRSRTPSASPLRQELRFVDGDHGMRRVQATTSGTLGERTYLVSLSRYDWDGFRVLADGSGNTYGSALRDQVNATFTSPLLGGELRVAANYLELDSENPGSLTRADYLLADRRAFPGNVNQRTGKAIRQEQLGFAWAGGIRGREVELALHGIRRDLSNPTPAAIIDLDRVAGGVRALVRSEQEGPAGQLWWAVGFESEFQSDDRLNFANAGGERGVLRIDQKERVSGGAVFVQALLPINRVLDVMTGLRYDRIRFTADDRFPRAPDEPTGTGERTLDSASPSFGLQAGHLLHEPGPLPDLGRPARAPVRPRPGRRHAGRESASSGWVRQDYLYLKEFARVFAWAVAKADRLESMAWYASVLDLTLNTEMELHRRTPRGSASSPPSWRPSPCGPRPGPTPTSWCAPPPTATWPTSWPPSCPAPGATGSSAGPWPAGPPDDPRYADWIAQYASEEFAAAADWLRGELDRVAEGADPEKRQRLEEIFVLSSSRYEWFLGDVLDRGGLVAPGSPAAAQPPHGAEPGSWRMTRAFTTGRGPDGSAGRLTTRVPTTIVEDPPPSRFRASRTPGPRRGWRVRPGSFPPRPLPDVRPPRRSRAFPGPGPTPPRSWGAVPQRIPGALRPPGPPPGPRRPGDAGSRPRAR